MKILISDMIFITFLGISVFFLGFEVLTAVVIKVVIFSDIAPLSPYINQRFGGPYYFHLQGKKSAEQETSVLTGG
jgi:hypothetical protein